MLGATGLDAYESGLVAMMVETMVSAMLKDRQGSGWMANAKLAETSWRQEEAEAEEGPTSG